MQFIVKKGTVEMLKNSGRPMPDIVDYILEFGEIIDFSKDPKNLRTQYAIASKLVMENDKEIISFNIESTIPY